MPFIEGESLRARLERDKRLTVPEAVALTVEVADALNYAHAAGIVHRDIKPENILLLSGHAMVADFGIARAITRAVGDAAVTSAGFILGTPAYMSPEQAAGNDEIDGRSDVYSLATVLFEMLTGAVPFTATTTHALIARRFIQTAPRLAASGLDVPAHLDEAVAAALAMEPDERPASAAAFARMVVAHDDGARSPIPLATRQTAGATPGQDTIGAAVLPSVAVLPFTNLSTDPENEFLSDGITEEIISTLSRLRTIRVAARSSAFAFKDRRQDVRAIAEQLGVSTVLDGSVRRSGTRVRVAAQLVDAQTGFQLWSDRLDRLFDDAFEIQDDIARAIAEALSATLVHNSTTVTRDSISGHVYELYLRGRFALNKRTESDLHAATRFFEDATTQNPQFALAFAGLADAQVMLGVYGAQPPAEVMPRARAAAEQALAIDPVLGEAHTTLGAVRALFDWDWAGADDAFRRAQTLSPRYPTAWQWGAMNHLLPRGRLDEARVAIDRARSLDPLSMVIGASVGAVYHLAGDTAGAIRALRRALEIDANFVMTHYFLGGALRDAGELTAAATEFRSAIARSGGGGTPEMTAGLAQTLAKQGDTDAARALQRELEAASATRHVPPCLLAQVHAALGDTDAALDAVERGAAQRDADLAFIGVRPAYAGLRGHPRFEAVRRRVGV